MEGIGGGERSCARRTGGGNCRSEQNIKKEYVRGSTNNGTRSCSSDANFSGTSIRISAQQNPITSGPNCGLIELAGSSGILSATGLLLGYNKINNINRTPGNVTYTSGECMYGNGRANIAKLGEEFGSKYTRSP